MRGAEVTYLGWARSAAGLVGVRLFWFKNLKKVLRELIFLLTDLAV